MPFNLQFIRMQKIRLIAAIHGSEGWLFSLSCRVGSLFTSIFYEKHFPVVLVFGLTWSHCICCKDNVCCFHSFNEVWNGFILILPGLSVVAVPALAGGWTRWSQEVYSSLNCSVTNSCALVACNIFKVEKYQSHPVMIKWGWKAA